MELGHKTLQTWLNLTFALRLAWKILESMAQTVVGAALLGAAGTAFLASPGPVSQTAPSLRGGTALPGNSGSTGVAGTAALASLAGVAMAAAAGRRSGATSCNAAATTHVTFDHGGKVPYIEGQSIGVIAPGPDKKGEQPAKIRLYSIASSAVGDDQTSKTVSLCVKRVVELDGKFSNRAKGEDKPDKAGTAFPDNEVYRGVCSNHICDMTPGDEVLITGPTGAEMLLPEDPEANIIMLATGTGIAPMRSYLRLLFHDKAGAAADGGRKFKGLAWLFMGVPYSKSLLYDDEHQTYKKEYPDQFRYDYAVSREDKNAAGQKMYIQTKMAEYAEELWEMMQDEKTHVYMCGLKGMESGMAECFGPIAEKNGIVWTEFAKAMKKADRYHVEVY
eukprot:s980_g24.t1